MRCASRASRNRSGRPAPRDPRPHPRLRVRRRSGVRHDPRGEGRDAAAGRRQRRHRDPGGREASARLHRRRRRDDRPCRARRRRGSSARSSISSPPGERLPPPPVAEIRDVLLAHLVELHEFYGPETRRARRPQARRLVHETPAGSAPFREALNRIESCEEQLAAVGRYFDQLAPFATEKRPGLR